MVCVQRHLFREWNLNETDVGQEYCERRTVHWDSSDYNRLDVSVVVGRCASIDFGLPFAVCCLLMLRWRWMAVRDSSCNLLIYINFNRLAFHTARRPRASASECGCSSQTIETQTATRTHTNWNWNENAIDCGLFDELPWRVCVCTSLYVYVYVRGGLFANLLVAN